MSSCIAATCQAKLKMKEKDIMSDISKACIDAASVAKRREEKAARKTEPAMP